MQIRGIDETDNRIINLLLEDGRMSYSDIAEKVGLSRTAVKARIAALERNGIIKGYKAIIDPQAAPEIPFHVLSHTPFHRLQAFRLLSVVILPPSCKLHSHSQRLMVSLEIVESEIYILHVQLK